MSAQRRRIPEPVKRVVHARAHGRCEFTGCSKIAARCCDDGSIGGPGEFAHILPVGENGPRQEYKAQFPWVEVRSAENVILLCREHHRVIDFDRVDDFPPAILFAMAMRKSKHVEDGIEDLYANHPINVGYVEMAEDVRIGKIIDLLNVADTVGPKRGRSHLNRADALLRELVKNPFVAVPDDLEQLIALQILMRKLGITYDQKAWHAAFKRTQKILGKIADSKLRTMAILLSMTLVRDEYGIIERRERLELIEKLVDILDPILDSWKEEPALASFGLSLKSSLLRWRGRLQESRSQKSSYRAAEICAERSLSIAESGAARIQLGLVKFAQAMSLPLKMATQADKLAQEAKSILLGNELDDFAAAIKYRPRFLRELHEFDAGMEAFWCAVDRGFVGTMRRNAFVLAECASSKAVFGGSADCLVEVNRAIEFVEEALRQGYEHGRNLISWINCRALVDPQWFMEDVHTNLRVADRPDNLMRVLHDQARRYFGAESGKYDLLFGVDEAEFWNALGRCCRVALNDTDGALEYYSLAKRHIGGAAARFTTKMGVLRVFLQKGDVRKARNLLPGVRSLARGVHGRIIADLERELEQLPTGSG